MMDQLASIGLTFLDESIEKIFKQNVAYYEKAPQKSNSMFSKRKQWAVKPIYDKHQPVRPWGLGEIYNSSTGIYALAGKQYRTPGLNVRSDSDNGQPTNIPMENTNERIHSCVRIRLELEGLGPDDNSVYKCPALLDEKLWRLRHVRMNVNDPIPHGSTWGSGTPPSLSPASDMRWIWEYTGPEEMAPKQRYMVEDNLGPYERKLLLMNKGKRILFHVMRDVKLIVSQPRPSFINQKTPQKTQKIYHRYKHKRLHHPPKRHHPRRIRPQPRLLRHTNHLSHPQSRKSRQQRWI